MLQKHLRNLILLLNLFIQNEMAKEAMVLFDSRIVAQMITETDVKENPVNVTTSDMIPEARTKQAYVWFAWQIYLPLPLAPCCTTPAPSLAHQCDGVPLPWSGKEALKQGSIRLPKMGMGSNV